MNLHVQVQSNYMSGQGIQPWTPGMLVGSTTTELSKLIYTVHIAPTTTIFNKLKDTLFSLSLVFMFCFIVIDCYYYVYDQMQ